MSEEIQYKTKSKIRNTYINVIGRVLVLIAVVQAVRLCIDKLLVELFWDRQSIFAYRIISSVTFIIVACLMLAFLRPDRESLGLKSVNDSKYGRLLYYSGAAIVLMLVCTSYSFGVETFVNNISFGIVVPISEELLFRGYIWSRLEQAGGKHSRIAVLAIVTILFGIWHLGYFDSLYYVLSIKGIAGNLRVMLLFKVAVGIVLGLLVGLVRLKSGKVYGSIIIHSLWNIFAP
ncbi:MAG: lysostaphin resistance A-like protein [Caulobacteraceae bacterium]